MSTGQATTFLSYYYEESTQRLNRTMVEIGDNPVPASGVHCTHNPSGDITKVADTVQSGPSDTQCFSYDYLRRLTEAWTATDDCAVCRAHRSWAARRHTGAPTPMT